MVKDGEGKHVKWEQQFMLECDEQKPAKITFEACEGSPLDHKVIGKTDEISINL